MVNVARCIYSNCISNAEREPLPHRLKVLKTSPMTYNVIIVKNSKLERLVKNLL